MNVYEVEVSYGEWEDHTTVPYFVSLDRAAAEENARDLSNLIERVNARQYSTRPVAVPAEVASIIDRCVDQISSVTIRVLELRMDVYPANPTVVAFFEPADLPYIYDDSAEEKLVPYEDISQEWEDRFGAFSREKVRRPVDRV